jgi:N utilization substance protein A
MVREVFELEVPEIEDGLVEIKNIAREAGYRTKVAVTSNDPDVDPQGACIGTRGSRIQAIVNELKNEKIDIIRWSEDPAEFIINALAPAKIINVELDPEASPPQARVIVPDDQLSLAIGREGQNVRLAAKLTGFKLDIKSYSQVQPVAVGPAVGEEAPQEEEYEA